jgi:hypothetical protein
LQPRQRTPSQKRRLTDLTLVTPKALGKGLTRYLERYEHEVRAGLITEREMVELAQLDILYDRAKVSEAA